MRGRRPTGTESTDSLDAASVVADLDDEAQEILARFSAEDQQLIVDLVQQFMVEELAAASA